MEREKRPTKHKGAGTYCEHIPDMRLSAWPGPWPRGPWVIAGLGAPWEHEFEMGRGYIKNAETRASINVLNSCSRDGSVLVARAA